MRFAIRVVGLRDSRRSCHSTTQPIFGGIGLPNVLAYILVFNFTCVGLAKKFEAEK